MKILILGGDGMLGHKLLSHFQRNHDVKVTLRQDRAAYDSFGIFTEDNSFGSIDVRSTDQINQVLMEFRPDAIINAVGLVKQKEPSKANISSIELNALLPHRLSVIARTIGARFVHLSTDCVFSGQKGNYVEGDTADAGDLYGRTKYLGEVDAPGCVTLRTSYYGLEFGAGVGLIEWFLAQEGTIKGFERAIYSGINTAEIARVIERVLLEWTDLQGVWHVSSEPINKYDLLMQLANKLGRTDIHIEKDQTFACDRSLNSDRFRNKTGYVPPSWADMLDELSIEISERTVRRDSDR